jgi:hypothetical protein
MRVVDDEFRGRPWNHWNRWIWVVVCGIIACVRSIVMSGMEFWWVSEVHPTDYLDGSFNAADWGRVSSWEMRCREL